MKKLTSLRAYLLGAVPALADNPDKLLTFAEGGNVQNTPRETHLSFEYAYTATLVLTDFGAPPDTVIVPILAWLIKNQPDRGERQALEFSAEILSNDEVDIEIRIPLTEFVRVTDNGDGTVSADTLGEPLPITTIETDSTDPLAQWHLENG